MADETQPTVTNTNGNVCKVFYSRGYGEIIQEKRGTNGRNYDLIFYVRSVNKTLAEMTEEEQEGVWGDVWNQVGKYLIQHKPEDLPTPQNHQGTRRRLR